MVVLVVNWAFGWFGLMVILSFVVWVGIMSLCLGGFWWFGFSFGFVF